MLEETVARRRQRWLSILFRLCLIGTIGVGCILRCENAQRRFASYDEGFSWRMVHYGVREIVERLPTDAHPPLHYLIWKGWAECFGTSMICLRGLSVILSIGGLCALAVLCQRTAELGGGQSTSNDGGTLLAVVLAALLVPQVEAGGTARMYGLGTVLNLATALLLWRSIANNKAYRIVLWSLYGLAAAAACGTHYFSFFNLLAQGIFVSGLCLNWTRLGLWRQVLEVGGGWLYAMTLAAVLFAPWLPTLLAQTRQVQEGWWVPPVTWGSVDRIGVQWLTGDVSAGPPTIFGSFLAVVMVGLIGWTLWRGKKAAWFFFLQAFVPWACVIAYSQLGNASLLQLHYLVFAQAALCGLWSVTYRVLPGWPLKLLFSAVLIWPCVAGLVDYRSRLPDGPSAMQDAFPLIEEQYRGGDWFLIDDYRQINLFRCCATEAGLPWIAIKAPAPLYQKGHVVHVASLNDDEIWWSDEIWQRLPARVWRVGSAHDGWTTIPVPGHRCVLQRTFKGGGETYFAVALWVRE